MIAFHPQDALRAMPARRRMAVKLVADSSVATFAALIALASVLESTPLGSTAVLATVACTAFWRVAVWRACGVYRSSWRLFGLREAMHMTVVSLCGTALLLVAQSIANPAPLLLTPAVIGVEGLLALAGAMGLRVAFRTYDERVERQRLANQTGGQPKRALLVGAGRAGRLAARELRNRPDAGYAVVGFIDDDPARRGQTIEGVRVLGTTHEIASLAEQARADLLILTMPSVERTAVKGVVRRCQAACLPVHTVPGYYELLAGKVAITRVRPLHLEDLLGRDVVEYDRAAHDRVQSIFRDRTILVTGAGGSIGSELCRQLSAIGPRQLLLVENNENNLFDIDNEVRGLIGERSIPCLADIRNERRLEEIFHEHRPEIVFHAAAFKHVPMMELHPTAAIDNNVRGTRVLTEVADRHGVERFLFVSTDKAVNPTNIMGASKRVAELIVQAKAATSTAKFCCVRFGNVLGSRGSVLHTFQRQLEAGGPITVTHPEVTRFFMTIPEAVRLVIQASAIGEGGEVFLLDMGKPVRIFDMARQMIQLAGFADDEVAVEIVGLRPGEKLYEELLRDDENSRCSSVDGVFVAKLASVDPRWVGKWVESLEQAARDNREGSIRQILASIADYQPMRAANDAPASSARKAA